MPAIDDLVVVAEQHNWVVLPLSDREIEFSRADSECVYRVRHSRGGVTSFAQWRHDGEQISPLYRYRGKAERLTMIFQIWPPRDG